MEYQLAGHFLQALDFFEGIRALIIGKDHAPNWRPAKLTDINQESIDKFFAPFSHSQTQLLLT